jgi:hypothetical protein
MGDEATQKWMDKLRERRRERRDRSMDRRHRRTEHLRTLQQTGKSPGGSEYDMNSRNVRSDGPR